jgi:hypothetical protein
MPRQKRLTREERLEKIQREERAEFILDEIIANNCWLNFQTHLSNTVFTPKIKCPLCRNPSTICEDNEIVGDCPICFQEKPLVNLSCYDSHKFCRYCLDRLI